MSTSCPSCSSLPTVGNDAAALCTDCGSVAVAGVWLNTPMLLTGIAAVAGVWLAVRLIRATRQGIPKLAHQPA